LDERSLRFGARSWQAGMTSLAWPQQNGPRGADFDSFSRHNDSRPVAMKLIDKKRGCFAKINAPRFTGQECVLGQPEQIETLEMPC